MNLLDATHCVPGRTGAVVGRIEAVGADVQELAASSIARTLSTRPKAAVAANVADGTVVAVAITLIVEVVITVQGAIASATSCCGVQV